MQDAAHERLRAGNSAARALPVLATIVSRGKLRVFVPCMLERSLAGEVAA